jgi:predicted DNA-binding protein YlxM (UPF0122 family)
MPLQRSSPPRRSRDRALAARTAIIRLIDTYGGVLTERQRALLRLYYQDDLSLGEIAVRFGVTRQAVFDSLRRSVAEMQHLEEHLGVVADRDRLNRHRRDVAARLAALEREVASLAGRGLDLDPLLRALRALREVL